MGLGAILRRKLLALALGGGLFFILIAGLTSHAKALTGINQQINFQGRLLNAQGATVADGTYNIEFKIYQDGDGLSTGDTTGSPSGSLKWTEDYLNTNSQGVTVKNGFLSVQLGSITPFGANINWNQDTLWVSMNIAGTGGACSPFSTCSPDGEMTPMKRLSTTPYALNAGQLGGLTSTNFIQLAQGVQTDTSSVTSLYVNKTGTGNILDLQSSGADAFIITNTGDATFGANANHTISVATAAATIAGKSLTIAAGAAGTGTTVVGGNLFLQGGAGSGGGTSGSVIIASNGTNSTSAFQVQNANGTTLLGVDTTAPANNLFTNPGFETNTTGWVSSGTGTTIARQLIAANTYEGLYSLQVNLGTGANNGVQITTAGYSGGSLAAGTYTVGFYAMGSTGLSGLSIGGFNGGSCSLNATTIPSTGFTRYYCTITTTGTTTSNLTILVTSVNPAILYIDGAQLISGNNLPAFSYGNMQFRGVVNQPLAIQNAVNSTTAFQVQNANSSPLLNVDTINGYVGISTRNAAFPLDVIGDVNTSTQYRIAGTVVCTSTGCTPAAGSNNYIQLQGATPGTVQTGNFNISGTGIAGTLQAGTLNTPSGTTTLAIGTANATQINLNQNTVLAAGKNFTYTAGAGNFDQSNSTGIFKTGSGAVTLGGSTTITGAGTFTSGTGIVSLQGATTVSANLIVTSAGSVAFQKGTDFSTTGTSNNVNLGSAALIRLTGASAQTVTGISGGTDGRELTLINAAAQAATISNLNAGSSAANQIVTGTGGDVGIPAGASLRLVYDAGANFWRVVGGIAAVGGYIQLQGTTPGTVQTGNFNISGTGIAGTLQAGSLDTASAGTLTVGGTIATTIQIGNIALSSGTQVINIGTNNTVGGTTNVTIGAGSSATGGSTTIQSKNNITFATNGVTRGTFDTANDLYLGNGVTAGAPNNFTLSGTGSSTTAVAGGSMTIQGGNATVGNANGGTLTLTGGTGFGTGTSGLVVLSTPTFSTTANDANCYTGGALVATSCTMATASVNNSSAVIVGFSQTGQSATLPNPTIATAGRVVYVTAANGSSDFTLIVNGGGTGNTIAMRQNTTATMIWNGTAWTAAGASSSTTLQSAYDNTLQSAGGAELVVSHTSNTNGLTIRDSAANPVNGTLLSVQTASAATVISVNGNVTEYSTDSGAETAGGSASTFPASTWAAIGSATVTRYTTVGNFIATGQASVSATTTATANDGTKNTLSSALTANMYYNVSFAARLSSGTFTDMNVYYSIDGSAASVACTTGQAVPTSLWTKVNCTFAAPSTGITASNALLIRQTTGTVRTFYIDNLSVTIAADHNYATDGSVDNAATFSTNWTAVSTATVTRTTSVGNDASDSAQVVTTGANQGVRNILSINPLTSTLYRVTAYVASTTAGFSTFTVQYSRNGGTNFVSCADYNTQTISSTLTSFTQVTCYITTDGTAATSPYVYFTQTDATGRTFYVDTFSMTLSTKTTPNVQIGGGINGGPVTLLTLDRAASAPIASNNDAFLGSMYYDTSLGKLQCYEASGWGACGSSPNNIVTISPEYTNAVMHGTGVGTMSSDICSGTLHLNDGTSSQPTICAATETYNFYKWTSPQASAQTYSIYVTYQLPSTFKSFSSGQTSLMGRTDSTNATVQYGVYNNSSGGLTQCGSTVAVSTGSVSSWQIGNASGAADPSTCGFAPGNSIVFKIDTIASQNANAYVGNLNFTFSNK